MKLSLDYISNQHSHWKQKIGEAGIWNPTLFQPVRFKIGRRNKTYNGHFQRKINITNGVKSITDTITIHNNCEDFDPLFVNSVLVHEMIHQYIHQAGMKDTSTHGKMFKLFMARINQTFKGELNLHIKSENPAVPKQGPSKTIHRILVLETSECFWLCMIHPSKVSYFEREVRRNKNKYKVESHYWALSNDAYFDGYSRCVKVLHGIKKPKEEMQKFCKDFNVKSIDSFKN